MAFPEFVDLVLEAKNPKRNVDRIYEIRAGLDMFGTVIVETRFGRRGTYGKLSRISFPNEYSAARAVMRHLARRIGASGRNGAPYIVRLANIGNARWFGMLRSRANKVTGSEEHSYS